MNYSKTRPFLIVILVVGVAYNVYFYLQNSRLEKQVPVPHVVIEQYCRFYKGSSSVHINYHGKVYYVRMANEECLKYPKGSKIYLVYNDRHDYFYQQDGLKTATYKLLFFPFLLLLSIIPWNRFLNKKND